MAAAGGTTSVGQYRLERLVGEGGMGTVYLARDGDGRRVALKLLHPHLCDDPVFRRRFAEEVVAARRVASFCTARVLDADPHGRRPFLAAEFVDGMSLHDRVTNHGPLSGPDTAAVAVGVAAALTAIHAAGVVHRDLKPRNVMLSPVGPKVIDFGIAGPAAPAPSSVRFGTPGWQAPEQRAGQPGGPPADVYAWGLLVAWTATGRQPDPARLKGVPRDLAGLVRKALATDPAARPTARELLLRLCGSGAAPPMAPPGATLPMAPVAAPGRTLPTAPPGMVRGRYTVPYPRVAPPRPRRRRRWPAAAALIVALATGAWFLADRYGTGSAQGEVPATQTNPTPVAKPSPTPPAKTKPTPPAKTSAAPAPGTASDGQLAFTLKGLHCGDTQLGDPPIRKQASGQYCLVELHVTNIGDQTRVVLPASQRLADAAGNQYTADSWAWLHHSGARAFNAAVEPGQSLDGTLVFDVPADAKVTELVLHDTPLSGGATMRLG